MPDESKVDFPSYWRELRFACKDGATIDLRRVLSVKPAIDPTGRLISVSVETLDVVLPGLLSGMGAGKLSLLIRDPRAATGAWDRHDYGRVRLESSYPTVAYDAFPTVTLVFVPDAPGK